MGNMERINNDYPQPYSNDHDQDLSVSRVTQFDRQIAAAPPLKELGLSFHSPEERKDKGTIRYTTLPETIRQWAQDPYGRRMREFIQAVYGIPAYRLEEVLDRAGLGEYLGYKNEGRYIGMVASQVLRPTYYFLANAFMLGHLSRQGIPTALMVGEYSADTFFSLNGDKGRALGKVEFPVAIEAKTNKQGEKVLSTRSVFVELKPYGIRNDDGSVTRIKNMDEANGYRCDQVLVEVTDAQGPENQSYKRVTVKEGELREGSLREIHVHYKAALGMHIPTLLSHKILKGREEIANLENPANSISITDFYKTLWIETINHLRQAGELPSQEEMPMFFVDAQTMYSVFAEEANPPLLVKQLLGISSERDILTKVLRVNPNEAASILVSPREFSSYLHRRNLVKLPNGLLARKNGVLDPSCYYVVQNVWPDGYLECSSCGGDIFVGKVARCQDVQQAFNITHREVRLPDQEVPDLERYVVHPTGRYFAHRKEYDDNIPIIHEQINSLLRSTKSNPNEEERTIKEKRLEDLRAEAKNKEKIIQENYFERVAACAEPDYAETGLVLPPAIAATYRELLEGVAETVRSPEVQLAIQEVRDRKVYIS